MHLDTITSLDQEMIQFLSGIQQNFDIRRDREAAMYYVCYSWYSCHITGCDFAGREFHAKVLFVISFHTFFYVFFGKA